MKTNNVLGFKSFHRTDKQAKIPDNRIFPSEVQTAIYEALKAAQNFSDKIYILENYLDSLLDRDGDE